MKLKPYQLDMLKQYCINDVAIIAAGTGIGKSIFNEMITGSFTKLDQAEVDDVMWHTVDCAPIIGEWIREQDQTLWVEHIDTNWYIYRNRFDLNDSLFALLTLRWSK